MGILAWHPDRLARNSVDGGQIIYFVDTGVIKELKFPTFWFDPTPQGKFMLSIAFGQSKYYIDSLSENIKRGQRQKLKNGIWPKMAPLGYLNDKKTKEIYIDKEKAPLIKKAFEIYATGDYTLKKLRNTINGLGLEGGRGGSLSISNYQHMLKNPIYYGVIRYNGELYNGKHKPTITKKLFDDVQESLKRKSKPQKNEKMKFFLYRGFFRCGECGYAITVDRKIKKSGKEYIYYYCTTKNPHYKCKQNVFTREEKISSQIKTEIQKVSLPDDWADWMIKELEKEKEQSDKSSNFFSQKIKKDISKLDDKLEKLMNDLSNYFGAGNQTYSDVYGLPDPKERIIPMTLEENEILESLMEAIQSYDLLIATKEWDDNKIESPLEYVGGLANEAGINFEQYTSKYLAPVPFGLTIEDAGSFNFIRSLLVKVPEGEEQMWICKVSSNPQVKSAEPNNISQIPDCSKGPY